MPLRPGAGVGHSESLELGSVSTVSASFSLYSPSDAPSQLVAWSAFLRCSIAFWKAGWSTKGVAPVVSGSEVIDDLIVREPANGTYVEGWVTMRVFRCWSDALLGCVYNFIVTLTPFPLIRVASLSPITPTTDPCRNTENPTNQVAAHRSARANQTPAC